MNKSIMGIMLAMAVSVVYAIPEPGALGLFAVTLLVLMMRRRKKAGGHGEESRTIPTACVGWKFPLFPLLLFLPGMSYGSLLTTMSYTTTGGGGQTGAAAETTAMIMSDGGSWSGGAAGVQGGASTNLLGVSPSAANVAFKFDLGAFVSSMDIAYGTGNWTVENIRLAFQFTLYANNSRFGGGAGDFDVYWVANDGWVQGSNNPVHATEATGLLSWSGDQEMLVRKYYSWSTATYAGTVADLTSWTTDKTGERQGVLTVELGTAGKLVSDMVAPVGGSKVSFYLMAASPSLGMTIFTGGASMLPTFSFDVVSVPEPAPTVLLGLAVVGWLARKNRRA
ncbi:MAG: PEP-CTERM sorting domain-containing protein [Chthoniobacterales bacterium]|nr:PEP-CTERM sorting domain-containing protein [Chthoniobacterales bacterium]